MFVISSFSSIFSSELLFGIFPVVLLGMFFEEWEEEEEEEEEALFRILIFLRNDPTVVVDEEYSGIGNHHIEPSSQPTRQMDIPREKKMSK